MWRVSARNSLSLFANLLTTFSLSMSADRSLCQLFPLMQGDADKRNDVIVCGGAAQSVVVFFGGDVQDYTEKMLAKGGNKQYVQWSLENTAELLHRKFPQSAVLVVRPSKTGLGSFSIYENFVRSDKIGTPNHSVGARSWTHLRKLYRNVLDAGAAKYGAESCYKKPIRIVGFSKGCVVLNQLVYDLSALDSEEEELVSSVAAFYWLDGGHSGGGNTWVTDDFHLRNLAALKCSIFVHMTPYQTKNPAKPWIPQEKTKFVEQLQQMGANVKEKLHFGNEQLSIDNHFKVLEAFEVE